MKKLTVLSAAACVAVVFASCGKTTESAYRKMYEKAKSSSENTVADQQNNNTYVPQVTPMEEVVATDTRVVDNSDNVTVRQENISLINGTGLKAYSVVVGSFQMKANAEDLVRRLRAAGYDAQLGQNGSWYRVIATTFDNKADAARSRDQLSGTYNGAWLLYAK